MSILEVRTWPNDLYAEFTIAAICLRNPDATVPVRTIVAEADFTNGTAAAIWAAHLRLIEARRPVTMTAIVGKIAATDPLRNLIGHDRDVETEVQAILPHAGGSDDEAEWCAWRMRESADMRGVLELVVGLGPLVVVTDVVGARGVLASVNEALQRLENADVESRRALEEIRRKRPAETNTL